jgi:hypothetical protein
LMKVATQQFNKLFDYEVGEVTAAAIFYLAETYARFTKDLRESERPAGLSALEREEYELAIEEQAYPFEEKAIAMHKSNLELISRGFYNEWIDKSLQQLARLVPARYDKPEEESPVIASLDSYLFAIERPEPTAPQTAEGPATSGATEAVKTAEPKQDAKPAEITKAAPSAESKQEVKPAGTKEAVKTAKRKHAAKPAAAKEAVKTAKRKQAAKPAGAKGAAKAAQPKQDAKPAETKDVAKAGEPAQDAQNGGDKGTSPDAVGSGTVINESKSSQNGKKIFTATKSRRF